MTAPLPLTLAGVETTMIATSVLAVPPAFQMAAAIRWAAVRSRQVRPLGRAAGAQGQAPGGKEPCKTTGLAKLLLRQEREQRCQYQAINLHDYPRQTFKTLTCPITPWSTITTRMLSRHPISHLRPFRSPTTVIGYHYKDSMNSTRKFRFSANALQRFLQRCPPCQYLKKFLHKPQLNTFLTPLSVLGAQLSSLDTPCRIRKQPQNFH